MAEEANIDAYFERIGFAGSIAPSLETLSLLHQLHPEAIPFENLDPLMGTPVRLELANLQQKLLFDRRGGYCLEHNLLFKAVLESLDFPVRALGARVLWNSTAGVESPVSHVVLSVEIGGVAYLADVGFGNPTPTAPLRFRDGLEQATPHETYRLTGGTPAWLLEVQLGAEWRPLYIVEPGELDAEALAAINIAVSRNGHFDRALSVARAEKGRRLALSNLRYHIHNIGGTTETTELGTVAMLREVLSGPFAIALPPAERLDPALQGVVERATPGVA